MARKAYKNLELNYKKAPFFQEFFTSIETLILNEEECISKYNIQAVKFVANKLGIASDKFHLSSQLAYEGHSNEMLVSITKSVKGG